MFVKVIKVSRTVVKSAHDLARVCNCGLYSILYWDDLARQKEIKISSVISRTITTCTIGTAGTCTEIRT